MHEIEKAMESEPFDCLQQDSEFERLIMFDGMGIVNRIRKSENMKTCRDFANAFIQYILQESKSFQQINLIFDRYITSSLKFQTRVKRKKGILTGYKISDDTSIENISLKSVLSHIETKKDLTAYLSEKLIIYSKENHKSFIFVYENVCKSNVSITPSLNSHEHEETDT